MFLERELGPFGNANRYNLCHFGKAFKDVGAILIAIECKFMLLCAFFNSLPIFSISRLIFLETTIDPLHKWSLNLNNNTWYILSLTLMFEDKGIFT